MANGSAIVTAVTQMFRDPARARAVTSLLPPHIPYARMARSAMAVFERNPKAWEGCNLPSIAHCVATCAQLGLEIDSVAQMAHLIPRKLKAQLTCTLLVGYRGLTELAARARVHIRTPQVVHENDEYTLHQGTAPMILHRPTAAADRGEIIAFYAVSIDDDGHENFAWLWNHEVEAIRNSVYKWKDGPWANYYDQMGLKTAIRRLCKYVRARADRPELSRAVTLDEQADANVPQSHTPLLDPHSGQPVDTDFLQSPTATDPADAMKRAKSRVDEAVAAAQQADPPTPAESPPDAAAVRDEARKAAGLAPLQEPDKRRPGATEPAPSTEPPDEGGEA
jgi:recombination protein RecT